MFFIIDMQSNEVFWDYPDESGLDGEQRFGSYHEALEHSKYVAHRLPGSQVAIVEVVATVECPIGEAQVKIQR